MNPDTQNINNQLNQPDLRPTGLPRAPHEATNIANYANPNYQAPINVPIDEVPQPQPAPEPAPPQPQPQPQPIPQPDLVEPQNPPPRPQPTVTNSPPSAVSNPNSTQNTLLISEIRDGIVIMNDGSFRAVIMLKSINFDLMSLQEQESTEYAYQGFLNSLVFPIQIFIRSQKIDIAPYIQKLDKIRGEHDNMLLSMLMEDYIGFVVDLAEQTNIMDKKFYIVIPYFSALSTQRAVEASKSFLTGVFGHKEQPVVINEADLATAKTELRNRIQSVLAGLLQCGVQGLPLDTQELIELFYDAYNPDTATRQQLKNFDDLSAPIVTKGEGFAPQSHLKRELQ